MSNKKKIVVVGGGTAGWMTAAALVGSSATRVYDVELVESDEINTIGVGEATVPAIRKFNDKLGIIESDMISKTGATFKLGIEFIDWGKLDNSYIHPFGTFGEDIKGAEFHQHWLRCLQAGKASDIEDYSFAIQAARAQKFDYPAIEPSAINSTFSYAYHLDAGLYAQYLRTYAEQRGIARREGKIVEVRVSEQDGSIDELLLQSGESIKADLFIDCSGFHSLLMNSLDIKFESWKQWLKCDRAITVASERTAYFPPYTQSIAKSAGWQWRIPLQHRTGNGMVYASDYISDDEASDQLINGLDGRPLGDPKLIKFEAGRREKSWVKNVVSIGLSSGFLEPLESTSIYLIQAAVLALRDLLPGSNPTDVLADEYNRKVELEYDKIRDFLILHYKLTERDDSQFWLDCKDMNVPDSLRDKIALFKKRGFIDHYRYGLFSAPSWLSVYLGQGLVPDGINPMTDIVSMRQAGDKLSEIKQAIEERVGSLPSHEEFIERNCKIEF